MGAEQSPYGVTEPKSGISRRSFLRAGWLAGATFGALGVTIGAATSRKFTPERDSDGLARTVHVTLGGDDGNSGESWLSPMRSLSAALASLAGGPGTVEVGPGTFHEQGLPMDVHQALRGRGPHATVVELSRSGTLVDLVDKEYCRFDDIGLAFASDEVTGTLVDMANTFTCTFRNVRISGTTSPGQVGVHLRDNAGDSTFVESYMAELDIGVQVDTAVNYLIGCVFSANRVAVRGGDAAGHERAAGVVLTDSTFRGEGDHYILVTGRAQTWIVKGCWFDGRATTAIEVGMGVHGPWLFSLCDIPALAGRERSLVINAADSVALQNVVFIDTGSRPEELVVDPVGSPRGSMGLTVSVQGTQLDRRVPATWTGSAGSDGRT